MRPSVHALRLGRALAGRARRPAAALPPKARGRATALGPILPVGELEEAWTRLEDTSSPNSMDLLEAAEGRAREKYTLLRRTRESEEMPMWERESRCRLRALLPAGGLTRAMETYYSTAAPIDLHHALRQRSFWEFPEMPR